MFSNKCLAGPRLAISSLIQAFCLPLCSFCIIKRQICIIICQIKGIHNIMLVCTIKYRSRYIETKRFCSKAQMNLQDLSNIHTGRYTQRVQHDIQRTTIRQERHILNWKYTGNDTLVSVTACHLITNGDLSLLCNINTNCLIYSRRQLIAILSGKYFGIYNNSILTVRYFQRGVTHFSCLLTEDRTQQALLSSQLSLSLRSYLTNQDIAGTNLCTNTNDSSVVQIFQCIITDTRNVSGDLFRSKLGITGLCLIFLNMDRCIYIIHNQSFT